MLADKEVTAHTAAPDAANICPMFTMDTGMHAFQQGRQSNHMRGGGEQEEGQYLLEPLR